MVGSTSPLVHVQAPAVHVCPGAHGPPVVPHVQLPFPSHRSEWLSQVLHVPASAPHVGKADSVHVVPVQHPLAHDFESHAHPPVVQSWPGAQLLPPFVLQPQPPSTHSLLWTALQLAHTSPPVPHVGKAEGSQVVPLQHPPHPDVVLQTHALLAHVSPLPHDLAHVPQCWSFEVRSAHEPSQLVWFAGQLTAHARTPESWAAQTAPPSQLVVQLPHAEVVVMLVSQPAALPVQWA